MIDDYGKKVAHELGHIQFINSINDVEYDKVLSWNSIANYIVQTGDTDVVRELKDITTHEEPLNVYHTNY